MNANSPLLSMPGMQASALQISIAYAGVDFNELFVEEMPSTYDINCYESTDQLIKKLGSESILKLPDIVILEVDEDGKCFDAVKALRDDHHLRDILIIVLSKFDNQEWQAKAMSLKVHDHYIYPFSVQCLHERIKILLKLRILRPQERSDSTLPAPGQMLYKMPITKRLFDILLSAGVLLFLSPLYLAIAVLVKASSKGPIIYRSKRVGTGYKIFDFYKFRSMHVDADTKLTDIEDLNLYNATGPTDRSVFFKVANDPRITRIGRFIRNTSLDELPQILNILKGDMSFVGNRPLPLYEAELLTSNEWSMRFLGPAGLTGLWQITKRGTRDVSEQERKELDNTYARSYSFWLDLKIILRTFPAMIQKEHV